MLPFPRPRPISTLPYLILRILYCFYADEGEKKLILVPGVVNSEINSPLNYRTYCIYAKFYVAFNLTMRGNHKIRVVDILLLTNSIKDPREYNSTYICDSSASRLKPPSPQRHNDANCGIKYL